MKAKVIWKKNMEFSGAADSNHFVAMDANEEVGGHDKGARPKELLLIGLGGCTGMDVISILKKMRVIPAEFEVEIHAETTEEHPMRFKTIHVKYHVKGEVDLDKVVRAVELSQTKYCAVSAILRESAELTYEIVYVE
ncbi:MAG: OsmC family protein [Leptospirales bacterium]